MRDGYGAALDMGEVARGMEVERVLVLMAGNLPGNGRLH